MSCDGLYMPSNNFLERNQNDSNFHIISKTFFRRLIVEKKNNSSFFGTFINFNKSFYECQIEKKPTISIGSPIFSFYSPCAVTRFQWEELKIRIREEDYVKMMSNQTLLHPSFSQKNTQNFSLERYDEKQGFLLEKWNLNGLFTSVFYSTTNRTVELTFSIDSAYLTIL